MQSNQSGQRSSRHVQLPTTIASLLSMPLQPFDTQTCPWLCRPPLLHGGSSAHSPYSVCKNLGNERLKACRFSWYLLPIDFPCRAEEWLHVPSLQQFSSCTWLQMTITTSSNIPQPSGRLFDPPDVNTCIIRALSMAGALHSWRHRRIQVCVATVHCSCQTPAHRGGWTTSGQKPLFSEMA
ncbi:hypothetical protein K470DRAFT_127004 [Piedraia hortae CBS 480.64]|uniref:Uncharacterized protein n=1 Tax=Piedraia hortae CBS 480.64 TaxID=1314780 RepID=A0A6A7C891_9PEZI|nr:hypothetical protein K470DRAFT_127004 [Piedraia hortae CBS 480.64]